MRQTKVHLLVVMFLIVTTALVAQEAGMKINNEPDTSSAGSVSGPWGRLHIAGIGNRYSVYLNGRGPNFFVGNVGDVDKRHLILPPGLEHVIIVDPKTDAQVYSGYVEIKPNMKATLHVDLSDTRYQAWPEGAQLQSLPRYDATGTTTAAVAPVTGKFSIVPGDSIDCGQPARLVWTTYNAANTLLKVDNQAIAGGPFPNSGELVVNPLADTTYVFETFGPGGVFQTKETLHVNKDITASLEATPGVVRYHRVGDTVLESGDVILNWTTTNATSVHIDPLGEMADPSGKRLVKYSPTTNGYGPIGETRNYTLTASNPCGVSKTMTASVHVDGSVDPEVVADLGPLPPLLPKTGSPLPLIGLLGLGSLASGLALRRMRKK